MTEQTFHITGLDPQAAVCGKTGRIWSGPDWLDDDDMQSARFVRCRNCDRIFTPALARAIRKARDLEVTARAAYTPG